MNNAIYFMPLVCTIKQISYLKDAYHLHFTDEDTGENTGTQRGCVMLSGGKSRAKAPECQWDNGTQL